MKFTALILLATFGICNADQDDPLDALDLSDYKYQPRDDLGSSGSSMLECYSCIGRHFCPDVSNETTTEKLKCPTGLCLKTTSNLGIGRLCSTQNFEDFKEWAKEGSMEFTGRNECHKYKSNGPRGEETGTVCICDTDLCNNANLVQIPMIGFVLALIINNIF